MADERRTVLRAVPIVDPKDPLLILLLRAVCSEAMVGSVTVAPLGVTEVEFTELVMDVTMLVDPECTPTTLTLDVSTMLSKAQRLLMKLVRVLLLLKKSVMFMAKWVVSWIDSVSYTVT